MTRTPTKPPTDKAMWRKLIAKTHPDAGGSHELFIWAGAVKDFVCDGREARMPSEEGPPQRRHTPTYDEPDAVSFGFESSDFDTLTRSALDVAYTLPEPYRGLLRLLSDSEGADCGALRDQQGRGATYKQLAAIGHTASMTKQQRVWWYRIAESIPLSCRHAGHILSHLKGRRAA